MALLLLMLPVVVQAEDFAYTTNNGAITIVGYTGPGGEVVIPSTIDGLLVTGIGDYAFLHVTSLTSISIPSSVTSIGYWAFAFRPRLTNVVIGSSVTNIGSGAFRNCFSLTSVTIPSSVTSMGRWAFYGCSSLTSITIPGSVTSIRDSTFSYCTNLTSVTIGGGVINIEGEAFYSCRSLASITIPSSVTSIRELAFYGCTSLASITIGGGVTSIKGTAFSGCTSLTAITVDADNSTYGSVDGVLFNKNGPKLVQFPQGMTGNYTIPSGVTSIGDYAFHSCTSLTNVTIPDSVTNIGFFAFLACDRLTAITVDTDNSTYGSLDGVLFNRSQTTLIQCPGGKIGNCTIPSSVVSIGDYAFYGCTSLTSVTIPSSVTFVASFAFSDCTRLNAVYFLGNTPNDDPSVFGGNTTATIYYLPGTTGWGPTFGGRPTALWTAQIQTGDGSFGVRTNQFGFNISWASGRTVVVEACEDLANPVWTAVGTNTLTDGAFYFSDPQWTNHPARFYRVRSP